LVLVGVVAVALGPAACASAPPAGPVAQTSPPGTYSCPDDNGQTFTLTFRAHPGGPALATAVLALTGCGGTALTVGAKENELGLESARPLAAKVLEVAGVPWKLPPFQWPPA
jgi:hypothetical protein